MSAATDHYAALDDGELAILSSASTLATRDAAFATLVRRYQQSVYRQVLASVADADEALDLVQETFLAAHRSLGRYDPARPMRNWLATIAMNKCRDWGRRRAVRRLFRLALPIEVAAKVAHDAPPPDQDVDARMRLDRVATQIAALPAPLREVLVLRTIEGLSQADVAAVLGVSEKAVETRLYRARGRLQAALGHEG